MNQKVKVCFYLKLLELHGLPGVVRSAGDGVNKVLGKHEGD